LPTIVRDLSVTLRLESWTGDGGGSVEDHGVTLSIPTLQELEMEKNKERANDKEPKHLTRSMHSLRAVR